AARNRRRGGPRQLLGAQHLDATPAVTRAAQAPSSIATACGATPRPVSAAAPQRAANAIASPDPSPAASAYVSPAAKQSPAPEVPSTGPGAAAAVNGPPGCDQPPRTPDVDTTRPGCGSSSPWW